MEGDPGRAAPAEPSGTLAMTVRLSLRAFRQDCTGERSLSLATRENVMGRTAGGKTQKTALFFFFFVLFSFLMPFFVREE